MKKFVSLLAVILSVVLLIQSVPVYAVADAITSENLSASNEVSTNEAEAATEKNTKPFILGEMEDERTLDTKIFRMSDGSYTAAVYPTQVHYEEGGEMKEIDYRFEEVTVKGESFLETKSR